MPREPGSYLLVLRTERRLDRAIGRLGTSRFRRGWHVYAGSALGGLRARLRHHLAPARPVRWHVDALHAATRLSEVWVTIGSTRVECELATALAALPGAERCARFGSSDCRCPGHLVSFARRPPLAALWPGLIRLPLGRLPARVDPWNDLPEPHVQAASPDHPTVCASPNRPTVPDRVLARVFTGDEPAREP